MTLAELLVALAIGSALLGLVLGIFDSTARLAKSARIAYSTPVSEDTVLPIRVTPDALLR